MITPEPRIRRDTDTDERTTADGRCVSCAHNDPDYRSRHYLSLAKFEGVKALRTHLTTELVTMREAEKRRPDLVDEIITWVNDLIALYKDQAHPETGAPLAWWEARAYCTAQKDLMAQRAYERAPAGYSCPPGNLEPWIQELLKKYAPQAAREPGDESDEECEAIQAAASSAVPPAISFPEEPPYSPDLSVVADPPDQLQAPTVRERYAGEESPEEEGMAAHVSAKQEIKRLLSALGHCPATLREAERVIVQLTDEPLTHAHYAAIIRKLTERARNNDVN